MDVRAVTRHVQTNLPEAALICARDRSKVYTFPSTHADTVDGTNLMVVDACGVIVLVRPAHVLCCYCPKIIDSCPILEIHTVGFPQNQFKMNGRLVKLCDGNNKTINDTSEVWDLVRDRQKELNFVPGRFPNAERATVCTKKAFDEMTILLNCVSAWERVEKLYKTSGAGHNNVITMQLLAPKYCSATDPNHVWESELFSMIPYHPDYAHVTGIVITRCEHAQYIAPVVALALYQTRLTEIGFRNVDITAKGVLDSILGVLRSLGVGVSKVSSFTFTNTAGQPVFSNGRAEEMLRFLPPMVALDLTGTSLDAATLRAIIDHLAISAGPAAAPLRQLILDMNVTLSADNSATNQALLKLMDTLFFPSMRRLSIVACNLQLDINVLREAESATREISFNGNALDVDSENAIPSLVDYAYMTHNNEFAPSMAKYDLRVLRAWGANSNLPKLLTFDMKTYPSISNVDALRTLLNSLTSDAPEGRVFSFDLSSAKTHIGFWLDFALRSQRVDGLNFDHTFDLNSDSTAVYLPSVFGPGPAPIRTLNFQAQSGTFSPNMLIPAIGSKHSGLGLNTTLTTLVLNENRLGDSVAIALGQALRGNRTLNHLELDDNDITLPGFEAIRGALYGNKKLCVFPTPKNDIARFMKILNDDLDASTSNQFSERASMKYYYKRRTFNRERQKYHCDLMVKWKVRGKELVRTRSRFEEILKQIDTAVAENNDMYQAKQRALQDKIDAKIAAKKAEHAEEKTKRDAERAARRAELAAAKAHRAAQREVARKERAEAKKQREARITQKASSGGSKTNDRRQQELEKQKAKTARKMMNVQNDFNNRALEAHLHGEVYDNVAEHYNTVQQDYKKGVDAYVHTRERRRNALPMPDGWREDWDLKTGQLYFTYVPTHFVTWEDPRMLRPPAVEGTPIGHPPFAWVADPALTDMQRDLYNMYLAQYHEYYAPVPRFPPPGFNPMCAPPQLPQPTADVAPANPRVRLGIPYYTASHLGSNRVLSRRLFLRSNGYRYDNRDKYRCQQHNSANNKDMSVSNTKQLGGRCHLYNTHHWFYNRNYYNSRNDLGYYNDDWDRYSTDSCSSFGSCGSHGSWCPHDGAEHGDELRGIDDQLHDYDNWDATDCVDPNGGIDPSLVDMYGAGRGLDSDEDDDDKNNKNNIVVEEVKNAQYRKEEEQEEGMRPTPRHPRPAPVLKKKRSKLPAHVPWLGGNIRKHFQADLREVITDLYQKYYDYPTPTRRSEVVLDVVVGCAAAEELGRVAVTVTTQCTRDRLPRLRQLCSSLSCGASLSAAVYVRASECADTIKAEIHALLHDQLDDGRLGRLYVTLVHADATDTYYPINALRNVSLEAATTDLVLVLDVDFVVATGTFEYLAREHLDITNKSELAAFVLPAFEAHTPAMPRTSVLLQQYLQRGNVTPFHIKRFPQGHRATDVDKWKLASAPYSVEYEECYEPYLIFNKKTTAPRFDERFTGYGLNKVQHVLHLSTLGFRFEVLPPPCFVVCEEHAPSVDHQQTFGPQRDPLQRLRVQALYDRFRAEIGLVEPSSRRRNKDNKIDIDMVERLAGKNSSLQAMINLVVGEGLM
eukprot:PhM_4_TR14216/c0_g1_i1/m.15165